MSEVAEAGALEHLTSLSCEEITTAVILKLSRLPRDARASFVVGLKLVLVAEAISRPTDSTQPPSN